MKLFGIKVDADVVRLEQQPDGSFGACYFCGSPVLKDQDLALLNVERLGPEGDSVESVCHGACADRARHV